MRAIVICVFAVFVGMSLQTAPVAAQMRTVSRVGAVAKPRAFKGSCPATIEFIGTIFVTKHPVMVEYQWERSDGAKGQKQRVEIRNAGQSVSDTWQLGAGRAHMRVWEKLHVLAPTGVYSPPAAANIVCT